MRLARGTVVAAVAALVLTLLSVTSPAASAPGAAAVSAASLAPAQVSLRDSSGKASYEVKEGVTFNAATGTTAERRAILDHILRMIRRSRPSGEIKIMTWNFLSREAADALIDKARKGTRVRILMDAANNLDENPNGPWRRLRSELRKISKGKKWSEKSVARVCDGSCRGNGGAAHAKYFLFSKVGKSRKVVVQGGHNLTLAAANNQWNEVYTYVDRKNIWKFNERIFDEMWKDEKVKHPYEEMTSGKRYHMFYSPNFGKDFEEEPMQRVLGRVKCKGARKAGTSNGRTIIRFAPDVIRGKRGMAVAKRLRVLYNRGCDVKIGYTVMGKDVKRHLTAAGGRGPVPIKHLVQDFDGDGKFDNYFHLKVLTVNGKVGADPNTWTTINGSANSSGLATHSDENVGQFNGKKITMQYQRFIDYWYNNFPTVQGRAAKAAVRAHPNPYEDVDMD